MGGTQSTRKITLVDDEKAGVIKLSESLAHRLRGQIEGQQATQKASEAAAAAASGAQEPLHASPTPLPPQEPVLPPPPLRAPVLPPPPPSFIEKPLPITPEPPKVPEVIPTPEPPKAPAVAPVPEPEPSKEPLSSGVDVASEPSTPSLPSFLGESVAEGSVVVEPPAPSLEEFTSSDETSFSGQSPPVDSTSIESVGDDVVCQISEPSESPLESETKSPLESEVFGLATPPDALASLSLPPPAPASAEEMVASPADSPIPLAVDAAAAAAAPNSSGRVIEVQLPPPETLLSAAFGSDVVETPPVGDVVKISPQVAEGALPTVSSLSEAPSGPDVDVAVKAGPGPTLAQPAGSIPPWSIYAEEAHLMVMRLREEKEQEVKKLNQEWREKMDAREKEFVRMANLSEEQVATALKEVESLFMKASCTPVCQNQQEAVMNCYQDHPKQSLRCSREVEHFTQCVDLSRLQTLMKQEAH